ncbi:hypothetical protein PIIN_07582 [Serendipita indica DSM 11827]|uniref:RNA-dependent RNA polymerase n=1 Tax=Serendipita indica (strain DSM 11827) TaxID=1109443 RepID=G4TQP0_SERID|nr:hypothetical protein PIIN_07582 [Serendipita indica DSM 11827]
MASSPSRKRSCDDSLEQAQIKRPRRLDATLGLTPETPPPLVLLDVPHLQHIWDDMSHGTLFELARLAIMHQIDLSRIPEGRLKPLIGSNSATVNNIWDVLGINPSRVLCATAAQVLDWEAAAHIQGDGSTLETSDEIDPPRAKSGRVAFTASLPMSAITTRGSTHPVEAPITLHLPKVGPSCLFTRVFGSHRFLRVKVVDRIKLRDRDCEALWEMALRPISLLGRVYLPLVEKNDTIWYYMEGLDRLGKHAETLHRGRRGSYGLGRIIPNSVALIGWWTPFSFNKEQPICKLATRLHLGVSDTSPGPLVEMIYVEDDIKRDGYVFTDGSGEVSGPLLRRFRAKCPQARNEASAYQIRISTAKGIVQVAESPDVHRPPQWMKVTRSMIKAKHGEGKLPRDGPLLLNGFRILDAAHFVVCIVQDASWRYPAQLSKQLIPILHHQGVPVEMLATFLEKDISETMLSLKLQPPPRAGESPAAVLGLAKAVQRHGNLIHRALMDDPYGRRPSHRMKSIESDEPWTLEDILPSEDEEGEGTVYSYANSVLYEVQQLYLAIIVGFNISSSNYFLQCWKRLLKRALRKSSIDFRISFSSSAYCMLVPDFSGQLPEGYISFTPPEIVYDGDNRAVDFTKGEVLIGRHPALLPTDIQKVRLANITSLKQKRGLIICSTQGSRPLADLLSGGDYDGDEAIIIWDRNVVNAFQNADTQLSFKPAEVDASFVKDSQTIQDLCHKIESMSEDQERATIAEHFLESLKMPLIHGIYNSYYLKAIDKFGFDSLDARILAHKSNMLLDAPKTSMRLLEEVKSADEKKYGILPRPYWKRRLDSYKKSGEHWDDGHLPTAQNNPLDILHDRGHAFAEEEHRRVYGHSDQLQIDTVQHKKLLQPWQKAEQWARGDPDRERELDVIRNVVNEYTAEFTKLPSMKTDYKAYQAKLFDLARRFATSPTESEVPQLMGITDDGVQKAKASLAYKQDCQYIRGGSTSGFPWKVASLILLSILAEGSSVKISFPRLARLTPHSSFVS